ncbi:MAG: hypothetical protein VYA34_03800 [Myxococcota bacterium]|nr:hypothetical protein [Myxococcota bacterium]
MKFCVLLMSLIFVSLQGCGLLEQEGGEDGMSVEAVACGADGECPDGQVCRSETASGSKVCRNAKIGEEHFFARVSLAVASSDEIHLVTVFRLPQGVDGGQRPAEVPSEQFIPFSLTAAQSQSGLSAKIHRVRRTREEMVSSPRSRWDFHRHQVGAKISESHRVFPGLWYNTDLESSGCTECLDGEVCWKGQCASSLTAKFEDGSDVACSRGTVVGESGHNLGVVFDSTIEDGDIAFLKAAAETALKSFTDLYALMDLNDEKLKEVDIDGNGYPLLVFTNKTSSNVGTDVVGFYNPADLAAAGTSGATGNESDILWVRPPKDEAGKRLAVSTILHEYFHLLNFSYRTFVKGYRQESLWLDEAQAHLIEDLMGYQDANSSILESVTSQFSDPSSPRWPDVGFATSTLRIRDDSETRRGQGYLLLRHYIDVESKRAGAGSASLMEVKVTAQELYRSLLEDSKLGFSHKLFDGWDDTRHGNFLLGVFATQSEQYSAVDSSVIYLPRPAGEKTGAWLRGDFQDTSGKTFLLEGPYAEDYSDPIFDFEGDSYELVDSGAQYFLLSGMEVGTYQLEGKSDEVGIALKVTRLK